ncbi:MAG: hypothetical protein Q7U54_01085 [Bacteroidales bacterium]|nr:hypothetical protein [Bacteroidales bacterium]
MKKINLICSILFFIVVASSCTKIDGIDQDLSFLNSVNSANLDKIFVITDDNSGIVKITPMGEGVATYTVGFGHGTGTATTATVAPGGTVSYTYPEGSYTVTIIATDLAGKSTTTTYPLTVTYVAPVDVVVTIDENMAVSATALYAKSFLVYYGDVANEVGTPMAIGETLPAHTYLTDGPFDLKVVALSGGAAKTEVVKTLFGLPITFENATMGYSFVTIGTGQAFDKIANPFATGLNMSASVGRFTRGSDGTNNTVSHLDIPIDFARGKKITMLVYNPEPTLIGKKFYVELQSAVGGIPANGLAVKNAKVTKSGEWELLTFDFSTFTTAQIPANTRFGQIVITYALGIPTGGIIYIDTISLTN